MNYSTDEAGPCLICAVSLYLPLCWLLALALCKDIGSWGVSCDDGTGFLELFFILANQRKI